MVRSLPSDGLSDGRQILGGEARSSSATLRPNVGVVKVYLSIHQKQHRGSGSRKAGVRLSRDRDGA